MREGGLLSIRKLNFRRRLQRPILLTGSFPNFNGLQLQNVKLYFYIIMMDHQMIRDKMLSDFFCVSLVLKLLVQVLKLFVKMSIGVELSFTLWLVKLA